VRNGGGHPAARVVALVRDLSGALPERELPIGWIAPGARMETSGEWPLSPALTPPAEPLEVLLFAQGGRESGTLLARQRIFLPVREPPLPRLVARLAAREEGDGNRHWDPGETLVIDLRIANAGEASSPGGRLLAEWPEPGVAALDPFPIDVPPLAPGEAWEAWARLRRENGTEDPGRGGPDGPAKPLVLRARELGAAAPWLELALELLAGLPGEPLEFAPPEIVFEAARPVQATGPLILGGEVRDDNPRDLTFRVNGRKVHYQAADGPVPRTTLPFRAVLPLDPGWNRIQAEARDADGLVTRRVFGVWKDEEAGVTPGNPGDTAR
jgi:hypothetical protein